MAASTRRIDRRFNQSAGELKMALPLRDFICTCGKKRKSRSKKTTARLICEKCGARVLHNATEKATEKAAQTEQPEENTPPHPSISDPDLATEKATDLATDLATDVIKGHVDFDTGDGLLGKPLADTPSQKATEPPREPWPTRDLGLRRSLNHTKDIMLAGRIISGQASISPSEEAELIARLWQDSADARYESLVATCPAWLNILITTGLTLGLSAFRQVPLLRTLTGFEEQKSQDDDKKNKPDIGIKA